VNIGCSPRKGLRVLHESCFSGDVRSETVAPLGDGLDGIDIVEMLAQGSAEPGDVVVDVGLFDEGGGPDGISDGVAADNLTGIVYEQEKDVEGFRGQGKNLAVVEDSALVDVDVKGAQGVAHQAIVQSGAWHTRKTGCGAVLPKLDRSRFNSMGPRLERGVFVF